MIPDPTHPAPTIVHPIQVEQSILQDQAPPPFSRALSQEEVRAIEVVFSQKQEPPSPVSGLAELWATGLLLQALTHQAAPEPEDEEKAEEGPAG